MRLRLIGLAVVLVVLAVADPAIPQDSGRINNARLDTLIRELDGVSGDIESEPGFWLFEYQERPVYVVVNPANNQLQILAPIVPADALSQATLIRTMQANFSATNGARYAIAKGLLWSVYANSVTSLAEAEFIVALKQVVSSAKKFTDLIVPEETKPEGNKGSKSEGVEVIRPEDGKS